MVILQGRTYHKLDSKEIKVQHKTWKSLCWGKTWMLPMITQIIEGKDGISHHEFNWYLGRDQNVDDDHDTIVERFHEGVIDQRWHQVKGMMKRKVIGTKDRTHTRNQACCSRRNDMMRKIYVGLAHRRNWCSRNKDQVAQLKSARQGYSQTG